ncbi:hypothetical protein LSTR_LSTR007486 [Laodelphax striatellus]|uniref:Uncharacterized protein n=1 Tax=Laodelphax striatellus TaxID=195883 RepID=A0A482X4F3_LAOST|nr:hypothetical protein LSTR_LSTR007486 [Laodelphax striatellus]
MRRSLFSSATTWSTIQSLLKTQNSITARMRSDCAASVMLKDVPQAAVIPAWKQSELLEFNRLLPDIVRDLTETDTRYYDVDISNKWFAKLLQYNMTGGSKMRGLAVVQAYRTLAAPGDLSEENFKLARIMGWCLEILHTSLGLTHDILNQAEHRNGKLCWYLHSPRQQPDEAPRLLQNAIFILLKKHFQNQSYYVDAMELFHDISHKAIMGMVLELETQTDFMLNQFTMDRYSSIAKYKTAYHSFKNYVSLGLYMAGVRDLEMHRQARTILLEMGHFYQVQKDYYNCFGNSEMLPGTDIEDGKCSWLVVVALQRASVEQKQLLLESYGSKDPAKVEAVKQLYMDLGLPSTFKLYEEHTHDLICTQIQQISRGLPHKLFYTYLKNFTMPLSNRI